MKKNKQYTVIIWKYTEKLVSLDVEFSSQEEVSAFTTGVFVGFDEAGLKPTGKEFKIKKHGI